MTKNFFCDEYLDNSDASELSSARFSLDSAQAGGFQLGSALEIFELARLAKIGLIRAKIDPLGSNGK